MFQRLSVFIILILAFPIFYWSKKSSTQETFPLATYCEDAMPGKLKFKSHLVVHGLIADKLELTKNPEKAAAEQIRFLEANAHFGVLKPTQIILRPGTQIQILSVDPSEYQKDLNVDSGDLKGTVSKKDLALKISYEAQKDVVICNSQTEFQFNFPVDPYLAFWFVPEDKRRKLAFQNQQKLVNPCADPQIVDMPAPKHYWYVWNPLAHGQDADGEMYDCRDLLKSPQDYLEITGTFEANPKPKRDLDFSKLLSLPEWNFSFLFGYVSNGPLEQTQSDARKFFASHSDLWSGKLIPLEKFERGQQDAAVWATLDFFNHWLPKLSTPEISFEDTTDNFVITLKGSLKKISKRVTIRIYLGPGNLENKNLENFIKSSLEESQVIFYIGHSRAGQNMDWSAIQNPAHPQPYQFIGVISCHSASLFTEHYVQTRNQKGLLTDQLLVNFSPYRYLIPIGLVDYLENPENLKASLSRYLKRDEIALLLR